MGEKITANRLIIITIILMNVVIYINGLKNGYIWDGNDLIKDNYYIRDIKNIKKVLLMEDSQSRSMQTGFFRPFVSLTYMLDYQIFDGETYGFRITNIAFHIACSLLIFFLIMLMTGERPLAFISAAIFSAQAVHAEAVTILLGRNNVICAFFILLSLYYYVKSGKRDRPSYIIYSMIFLFLGAASKEFAFTLPLIFVLYDYSFDGSFSIKRHLKKYMAAIFTLAVFMIYKSFAVRLGGSFGIHPDTLYQRVISTFPIMIKYMVSQVVPYDLYYYYDRPMNGSFFEFPVIASFLFLAALIFFVFKYRKKEKLIFFSFSAYLILLLPVSNILTLPKLPVAIMADRWLYPASAAFSIFLAGLIMLAFKKNARAVSTFSTVFIIFLSVFLINRNSVYKTNISMLKTVVVNTPDSGIIRNALGLELLKSGDKEGAKEQYLLAIGADPDFYQPYVNLGMVYVLKNDYKSAYEAFKTADGLKPKNTYILSNLALCQRAFGNIDESNRLYEEAVRLNAELYTYYELAENYLSQGRFDDALSLLQGALNKRFSEAERADILKKIEIVKDVKRKSLP